MCIITAERTRDLIAANTFDEAWSSIGRYIRLSALARQRALDEIELRSTIGDGALYIVGNANGK